MRFTFKICKTFCDGTTGSETTGKTVEGFENPVFTSRKSKGNFIKQISGKLDSSNSKSKGDVYKKAQFSGNRMIIKWNCYVVAFMSLLSSEDFERQKSSYFRVLEHLLVF